jgi:CBS domain-containing protein
MFTEKEILTNILPSYLNNIGVVAYDVAKKTIKERINALLLLTVKDIMRTEVISVREDTSIFEIARIMIKDKTRRIPVLNNNNEVVGIIARVDIMKFLFL